MLDDFQKSLSEALLHKLVGIFSTKDLQHSTPALTFLKEIAENIPKDDPKSKEKKDKKDKKEKKEKKEKNESKEKKSKEEDAENATDKDKESKTDFTVGCTVVTKAAKQKACYDGQKGKVEQVLSQHLKILLLTGPSKGETKKFAKEMCSLESATGENPPDQTAGQKRKAAESLFGNVDLE